MYMNMTRIQKSQYKYNNNPVEIVYKLKFMGTTVTE
jgi:hypothetical protein